MRILILLIVLSAPSLVRAQFNDHDGMLTATWSPPEFGNPLDHYIWSYEINAVTDSLAGESPAGDTLETSAVLADIGDWAIFHIRAISIMNDTSVVAVSDTAYYNPETGIGPPTGVNWIQGP